MEDFIKECRSTFQTATGQIPVDDVVSRYALAYQISLLNQNIEDFLEAEGILEDLEEKN